MKKRAAASVRHLLPARARPGLGFCSPVAKRENGLFRPAGYPPLAHGAAATRKPRLLFRLPGSFLLRYAERQFSAELFQLPPRITRLVAYGRLPATFVARWFGISKILPQQLA